MYSGSVAEWLKAHDSKSCGQQCLGGSNPLASATKIISEFSRLFFCFGSNFQWKLIYCSSYLSSHPGYSTQAAEGETMPTVMRAVRREDASSIKAEVVRSGSGTTARRPPVAVDASVPQSTSSSR